MSQQRRELLVLLKDELRSRASIEVEVEWLQDMLYQMEQSLDPFCNAHEVIDLNRYKVFNNPNKVKLSILRRDVVPFEFISNKN